MDEKALGEQLGRIEAGVAAAKENSKSIEALKSEFEGVGEKLKGLDAKVLELQQAGVKAAIPPAEHKSVGEVFVKSEAFKAFAGGAATRVRIDLPEAKADAVDPITTPAGGVVQAYRRPGVLEGAFRPFTIEQLFPSIPVASNAYEYVKETDGSFVNGAAFVAEGAQKPFGSTQFELVSGTIKTIAHLARISKQMLEDAPALAAYINRRIVYGVDLAVEDQIVAGDGTGQNLSGIFTTGNYTAHGATLADLGTTNATLFDLILFAKTKIEEAQLRPNAVLLNPTDWSKLLMLKNTSGDYYLGEPSTMASKQIWGLPVVTTPAITAGTFMVGDFNAAGTVWLRSGMTVELFEQDSDNVEKNLITIRAERRLGFGVERPLALCGGALTVPTA